MRHMTILAGMLAAAAGVAMPGVASAQTYFSFSVGTGYPDFRPPAYRPYDYYDDDEDARAAWIARERWEQRQRWERDEARQRYLRHEYWERHRWDGDDDEDDD